MRRFASKIELLALSGDHLRFVPGELARAMVDGGSASIANQNGKVKSIRLIETAQTHGLRIGPPTGDCRGTKFTRWVRTEAGFSWIEHHPRCWWME